MKIDFSMRNIGDRNDPYSEETVTVWDGKTKVVESIDSSLSCSNTVRFYNRGVVVREVVIDYFMSPLQMRKLAQLKVNLLVKRATGKTLDEWHDEYQQRFSGEQEPEMYGHA